MHVETYLQTGWVNFLFHFSMKSVCVCACIALLKFIQVDDELTGKNPKAVYFVVIVTMDLLFFFRSRFFFSKYPGFHFWCQFHLRNYAYLPIDGLICVLRCDNWNQGQTTTKYMRAHSAIDRRNDSPRVEKNGVSFFFHSSNFILIYLPFAK